MSQRGGYSTLRIALHGLIAAPVPAASVTGDGLGGAIVALVALGLQSVKKRGSSTRKTRPQG